MDNDENGIEIRILENSEQEAHVIGNYVCVCWNLRRTAQIIQYDSYTGLPIVGGVTWERDNNPYISFTSIGEHEGNYYADEDCSVEGGLSASEALELTEEIIAAIRYIQSLGYKI